MGQYTGAFPFEHIVLVMQENHSFDNYLGMLPVSGQPKADGFKFNKREEPVNWNPIGSERMYVYHQSGDIGASNSGSQSWDDSHEQIADGRMSGFAQTGPGSMGNYQLHRGGSALLLLPCQDLCLGQPVVLLRPGSDLPQPMLLMSGTASGVVATDIDNVTIYPANGTIWDQLTKYQIPWLNYFSDAPTSAIQVDTVFKYPDQLAPIERFYADAMAGTLPAVSLVDCNMGAVLGDIPGLIEDLPAPVPTSAASFDLDIEATAQSEENPEDVQLGEAFVAGGVNAVMSGPAWRSSLLIWFYDEHGGYYDHVRPPAAIAPDNIPPDIGPSDYPGGYNLYGIRVPAVIVSPYSKSNEVTNVVHDHTSVLATIESQWNLPASPTVTPTPPQSSASWIPPA